ncbi:hypothetical protein HYFRA_00009107 [Hymenoscyphus fraxineus]|uniref:Uncharacterized protein n=1 Tax=Hymenoscyphus fraxineus TaxID=746836 RepID=A0A9N9PT09_9HELO|nr:hypothetical protein HYFRA_00009107 [Hymenoscyphus fraxineus]
MKSCSGSKNLTLFILATFSTNIQADDILYSALDVCPASCTGIPESWTVYNEVGHLTACDQPMLFDFAVYNPLDNPLTHTKIRACKAEGLISTDVTQKPNTESPSSNVKDNKNRLLATSTCFSATEKEEEVDFITTGTRQSSAADLLVILQVVQKCFQDEKACDSKILFGYFRGAIVGVYTGPNIDNHATTPSILSNVIDQLCGSERTSENTLGVITDTKGRPEGFSSLQKAVRSWSDGKCHKFTGTTTNLSKISIWESKLTTHQRSNYLTGRRLNQLNPRTDCPIVAVASGDGCGSLATKVS